MPLLVDNQFGGILLFSDFLRCCLFKAEDRREMDSPQIALNWGRYVDTKGLGNRDMSSAIHGFLATTIGSGHVKKDHRGKRLPRVLIGAKKAKSLKMMEEKFNEITFKDFWEVEGGQVSLTTVSSYRFYKNVEALEVDPEFENYNHVKR